MGFGAERRPLTHALRAQETRLVAGNGVRVRLSNVKVEVHVNVFDCVCELVLRGTTDFAPRQVPWKNTAVLGSTVVIFYF